MTKKELLEEISEELDKGASRIIINNLIEVYRLRRYAPSDYYNVVLRLTCNYYAIDPKDIKSKTRERSYAYSRRIISYVLSDYIVFGERVYSDDFIASLIGRDRTTVVYNRKKSPDELKFNFLYKKAYDTIIDNVNKYFKNENTI
jgi:chromosomal replication initiation ATPase DnaA